MIRWLVSDSHGQTAAHHVARWQVEGAFIQGCGHFLGERIKYNEADGSLVLQLGCPSYIRLQYYQESGVTFQDSFFCFFHRRAERMTH